MRHQKRLQKNKKLNGKSSEEENSYASRWADRKFEIKLCCAPKIYAKKWQKKLYGFELSFWFSLAWSLKLFFQIRIFIVVTFRNYFMIMRVLLARAPFNTDQCFLPSKLLANFLPSLFLNIWNRKRWRKERHRKKKFRGEKKVNSCLLDCKNIPNAIVIIWWRMWQPKW